MKKSRSIMLAVMILGLVFMTAFGAIGIYADEEIQDEGCAEGDANVPARRLLMAGANSGNLDRTPLDVSEMIRVMLSKAGRGYSQDNRYDENYFDCSSLVQRSLKECGITQNVPLSTYFWYEMLESCQPGDVITFTGTERYIQYVLTAKNITVSGNEKYFEKPGTIMVLIAPDKTSGHICVSLGSFARQDNGLDPIVNRQEIITATENYVAGELEKTYGIPASLFTQAGSVSGVRSIWLEDKNLGTDMLMSNNAMSGKYNPIFRIEAYNASKGVCVDNSAYGTAWTDNVRYVLEPVDQEEVTAETAPEITGITISDLSSDGYLVTASFNAEAGIRNVQFPTWTQSGGQDDLIWHEGTIIDDNTAEFYVSAADHKNEYGTYTTHVYVKDALGRQVIAGKDIEVPKPVETEVLEFTSVTASDISQNGYRVTAEFNAPAGVSEVLMPTWTEKNGQDDLVWHKVTPEDAHTAVFDVKISDHKNERGAYITHVYVRDKNGGQIIKGVNVIVPEEVIQKPEITDVQITDLTSDGYLVTAKISAPGGIREVLVPTWTDKDWQDDLIWHKAEIKDSSTASFYVKTADHNNESGRYYTHVYLYDINGEYAMYCLELDVPEKETGTDSDPVVIAEVTDISEDGYRVNVDFKVPSGVKLVQFPTWTEKNWQDDLIWYNAVIDADTASLYIPAKDHNNESGLYNTHIYIYDNAGNLLICGITVELPEKASPAVPETPVQYGIYIYDSLDFAPVFDPEYYLSSYEDLKKAFGTNADLAFKHFINHGISEARTASLNFSVTAYRNRYEDLRNAFGSDLKRYVWHYLKHGIYENRIAN